MDWFHCNWCCRKDGDNFFVTSCGHIFCKKCVTLEKCAVCGTACKHLALSDNLKPQEKIYFKSPVETALQYFSHISQVWSFQKKQTDLLIAFYKHRITKLEAAMQEAQQTVTSQEKELSVLKKENGELKKFLAILKESPNWYQGSRSATPRPVGITSPSQSVTPRPSSQHSSQVVSRSSSVESVPYRMSGFTSLGQKPLHQLPLTAYLIGQRESRTPLESLPGFQLPVQQTLYEQRQMGLARAREAWTTSR
ncbi:RING finger protein 212B isoform X5 [Panthera tigris]|uniref:RING finger protein 212B isoform X5 n=1 Tax=Panthera leo TaxID=9689 RepID=UPI001C69AF15|nr:RING finger protein 212B isoform X5 [Panthera leo]XP_042845339.1 RING finger protein 212B isoform X5 [Panthera tigris]